MSTNAGAIESSSDAVVSSEPPSNSDIAVSSGVTVVVGADSLDTKTETLTTELASGGITVQVVFDGARVSGGEIGVVMDEGEKPLDVSSSDAVVSSAPPEIGAALLESKTGTVTMETSDHDGGGDIAVQDSVDDGRVSRDGTVIVTENSELVQDLVGDARVSGDEIGILMGNDEKRLDVSSSDAVVLSAPPEIGADLLESKSGTLTMETTDHDGGGDIVAHDSIDDAGVSRDGTGIVVENSKRVLDKPISDAVGSETETLTMKPSADQNGGGNIAARGSNDDSRVTGDEKGIVMESVEKASYENEVNIEENEGEYKVTDLVWAKVKDYPWWPGQIFDPSSSTDKAKKYSNKKGYLVGYFGDQTFAWNKASKIKPFRKNFCKLEKQSNSKAFFHAVNCALDEVSRRIDFGLTCSCISKEVRDKIKTQVFVNSGIREEASKIDGGDRFSTVSTFKPVKVVQSVKELAREHFDGFNRLEVLSVRTQLLAFFRWKGYYQFGAKNILGGLDNKLEDESELQTAEENKVVEDEKPASVGKKVPSEKRKPDASDSDDSVPRKKESLTNVTPKGNSSVKRSKTNISKEATPDDNVSKEGNGNEKPASVCKEVPSKKRKPDVSDSDDSVPRKKERSLTNVTPKGNASVKISKKNISKEATSDDNVSKEGNGNEKPASVGKKVSSKNRNPDVSDSDESVPRKKEKSLTNMTPKGDSSVKRSKKSISKEATPDDNVFKDGNGNEKPASVGKKVSSKKRKPDVSDSDDSAPRKKEKSLLNMTAKGNLSVKGSKKSISKKATIEDYVSKEENGNGTDDKKSSIASPKKLFRVGDSICRIAKQISESPMILKKESQKSKNAEES